MIEIIDNKKDDIFQSVLKQGFHTLCPLFNEKLMRRIGLSKKAMIHHYVDSMNEILREEGTSNNLVNQQLKNQSFAGFGFLENKYINAIEKEKYVFLQTLISASFEDEDNLSHPSYQYILNLLNKDNLLAGFGMNISTNNGIDTIILNLDDSNLVLNL